MTIPVQLKLSVESTQALAIANTAGGDAYTALFTAAIPKDEVSRVKAMLVGTIVDGLHAVVVLVPSCGQAHADTIVRSMVEALGDLYHLKANGAYLDRMLVTSAQQVRTAGETFISESRDDPSLRDIVILAKRNCKDAKQTLDRLPNVKALTTLERVRAPGLPPEPALGLYEITCFDAHHDLSALQRRHERGEGFAIGQTLHKSGEIATLANATLVAYTAIDVLASFAKCEKPGHDDSVSKVRSAAERLGQMFVESVDELRQSPID